MRRRIPDLFAGLIILFVILVSQYRLFFPEIQILITPDYGTSDAWHTSFSFKYILADAIRHFRLPLWHTGINDGFPVLAEGQAGTFFLPNIILYSLVPFPVAYNLTLIFALFTAGFGMYILLRTLTIEKAGSLFGGLVFAVSAQPILHLTHISLLQGLSLIPLILATVVRLLHHTHIQRLTMVLMLLVSQQFFTGAPQTVLITAMLILLYSSWHAFTHRSARGLLVFLGTILGFMASAAQILPSREFLSESVFPNGFGFVAATQFSMPISHLLTFFSPYFFGDPKLGSYPHFALFGGSIFWENTAYIGLLPLLFFGYGLKRIKSIPSGWFWIGVGILGILLAWGRHSPIYLLYTFWPMNLFRVPSRFLWLTAISLIIVAVYGFDRMWKRFQILHIRILLLIMIFITVSDLILAFHQYHIYTPALPMLEKETQPPKGNKIYTIGVSRIHNEEYLHNGWSNPDFFRPLLQYAYAPNANVVYGIPQHDITAGRFLYRSTIADSVLSETITVTSDIATVSASKILDMLGITTVVSFTPIDSENLTISDVRMFGALARHVYDNPGAVPRAWAATDIHPVASYTEAVPIFLSDSYTPGQHAVVSRSDFQTYAQLQNIQPPKATTHNVRITDQSDTYISIQATISEYPALIVLTDTFYPGWNATVDGKKTHIFPVNLKQRGVVVGPGTHTIEYSYQPKTVHDGICISAAMYLAGIILMVLPIRQPIHGTVHTASAPAQHHRRRYGMSQPRKTTKRH